MTRKTRLHYLLLSNDREEARIETAKGWYICSVERCSDEGRRKFRQRARMVQQAIEKFPQPMILTSPDEC